MLCRALITGPLRGRSCAACRTSLSSIEHKSFHVHELVWKDVGAFVGRRFAVLFQVIEDFPALRTGAAAGAVDAAPFAVAVTQIRRFVFIFPGECVGGCVGGALAAGLRAIGLEPRPVALERLLAPFNVLAQGHRCCEHQPSANQSQMSDTHRVL